VVLLRGLSFAVSSVPKSDIDAALQLRFAFNTSLKRFVWPPLERLPSTSSSIILA